MDWTFHHESFCISLSATSYHTWKRNVRGSEVQFPLRPLRLQILPNDIETHFIKMSHKWIKTHKNILSFSRSWSKILQYSTHWFQLVLKVKLYLILLPCHLSPVPPPAALCHLWCHNVTFPWSCCKSPLYHISNHTEIGTHIDSMSRLLHANSCSHGHVIMRMRLAPF